MAAHCFCELCQASVSPAADIQLMRYEVVTAPFPEDREGYFVQFANDRGYTFLTGRELFGFPDGQLHVGISGVYFPDYDASQVSCPSGLRMLGLGGRFHYAIRIAGDVRRNMYKTRAGNLAAGAELTLKIGCGGRVGPVAAGTAAHGVALTEGRYGYTVGRYNGGHQAVA